MRASNIRWHEGEISKEGRNRLLGHKNKVIWFTGLSGSGKSTLARILEKKLHDRGILSYVLDGDNIRHGLNSDLGFSEEDRNENIRRVSEITRLFYDAGLFVIVCFISPFGKDRESARKLIGQDFVEVFLDCPLDACEKRDTKGLYAKAKSGEIKDFTGISHPYEKPLHPELTIDTSRKTPAECVDDILGYLETIKNK